MSNDKITQAAANKAAEEGGLPVCSVKGAENMPLCVGCCAKRGVCNERAAAGRASRQVANKAEDGPDTQAHAIFPPEFPKFQYDGLEGSMLPPELWDYACLVGYRCATPPATTGASTARLESILDRLDDAIGGYSGGPFDKVLAIIDELRSAPDCGACPGDGSMCKSRCKVEEESPTSTVLTDDRIGQLYEEATSYTLEDDDYAGVRAFAQAIAREVAAQAGQVAVLGLSRGYESGTCTNLDLAGTVTLHYESPQEAEAAFEIITDSIDAEKRNSVAAPSPAKESK